ARSAEELDLLGLHEGDGAAAILVEQILNRGDGEPNSECVVMNLGNRRFRNDLATKLLHSTADRDRRRRAVLFICAKPELALAGYVLACPRETVPPVFEHACLFEPVSHRPRTDVPQQREDVAPLREPALEVLA